MKANAGLWIDHHEAIIVVVLETGNVTKRIHSRVEMQRLHSGGPSDGSLSTQAVAADGPREREYAGHLAHYYDEIISYLREARLILIFGPGEAKDELKRRFGKHNIDALTVETRTAEKMTVRQVELLVHHHRFHRAAAKPGVCMKPELGNNHLNPEMPGAQCFGGC